MCLSDCQAQHTFWSAVCVADSPWGPISLSFGISVCVCVLRHRYTHQLGSHYSHMTFTDIQLTHVSQKPLLTLALFHTHTSSSSSQVGTFPKILSPTIPSSPLLKAEKWSATHPAQVCVCIHYKPTHECPYPVCAHTLVCVSVCLFWITCCVLLSGEITTTEESYFSVLGCVLHHSGYFCSVYTDLPGCVHNTPLILKTNV